MKRIPTKHIRIWLVVRLSTGSVYAVRKTKYAADYESRRENDLARSDTFGIRPAYTSDTKGKSGQRVRARRMSRA